LADDLRCVVILKGSGTIIAAPETTPWINPTGNGRLATAGAGDVLAGFVGAKLAAGAYAIDAACSAVNIHGRIADCWPEDQPFTASDLLKYLPRSSP
jgi:NAD(P)H-hydrate repair Nnr-like enzyme with NAD(P)H-hydrate dehydratase domain